VDSSAQSSAASDAERRFQHLVEHIPGVVVYLDVMEPDDREPPLPVYISPQVEELLGYPREAWLTDGELWGNVLHPDDREPMIAADAHARDSLSLLSAEYRLVARDGRVVWVNEKGSVVRDEVTGRLYWQGVMVDITERRRADEALAASERQYRSVFDAAAIGLMTLGLAGCVLEANPVLERVLDFPSGALDGATLGALVADGDSEAERRFVALASGAVDRVELEHLLRRHDGSLLWCRSVMALVRDAVGRPDHVTAMVEDIDERKRAEADLVHRTIHDPLTALPNRQHFLARLAEARSRPLAPGLGAAVVFIDMDDFKQVNDSFGHHVGDTLLAAVAGRLLASVRPADLVARFGGDEFVVLVSDLSDATDASQLAWRLTTSLRAPFSVDGRAISVTASLGVAYSSDAEEEDEDLVRKADAAMYTAKQRGSDRVAVFGEPESAEAAA
jgi:diguanylate cyclase (GGDEF)-like protein/PAS domain S-box-containing protein